MDQVRSFVAIELNENGGYLELNIEGLRIAFDNETRFTTRNDEAELEPASVLARIKVPWQMAPSPPSKRGVRRRVLHRHPTTRASPPARSSCSVKVKVESSR